MHSANGSVLIHLVEVIYIAPLLINVKNVPQINTKGSACGGRFVIATFLINEKCPENEYDKIG